MPLLRHRPYRFFKNLRRGLYLSLLLSLAAFAYACYSVYVYADLSTDEPADAAIVLGAAAWGDNPSPVFKERINHAIDLYHKKQVQMLIFTGGTPKPGFPTEAEVGKNYAVKKGVPKSDIIVETNSRTTYQNLAFVQQEIRGISHLNRFILVSDPYHMARAKLMAEDLNLDALTSPTPTSRFSHGEKQAKFFFTEAALTFAYYGVRLTHWFY